MVYTPTRGDGPLRFGPSVAQLNDLGAGTVPAEWYLDAERYGAGDESDSESGSKSDSEED